MKFLISILITFSIFGLLLPLSSKAEEVCNCVLTVAGADCNYKAEGSFGLGDIVTYKNLLDKIPSVDCPGKLAFSAVIKPDEIINVTKDTCQIANNISQTNQGYTYSVSCGLGEAAPPAPGTPGGGPLPSSNVDTGACVSNPKQTCIRLTNPLISNTTEITDILGTIIRAALGLIGSLTLLMMVWGGFQLFTAAGNPERVKKGGQTMLWAALGVVVVFASYFIIQNFTSYLTTGQPAAYIFSIIPIV